MDYRERREQGIRDDLKGLGLLLLFCVVAVIADFNGQERLEALGWLLAVVTFIALVAGIIIAGKRFSMKREDTQQRRADQH